MCSPPNPGKIKCSFWLTGWLSCGQPHFQKVYVSKVYVPERFLGKKGKTLQKKKEVLGKEKSKEIQKLESISVHPVHGNPRTGLLRTFWEPDRVLRSPFRGLCVQGAQNCPSKNKSKEQKIGEGHLNYSIHEINYCNPFRAGPGTIETRTRGRKKLSTNIFGTNFRTPPWGSPNLTPKYLKPVTLKPVSRNFRIIRVFLSAFSVFLLCGVFSGRLIFYYWCWRVRGAVPQNYYQY